MADGIGILLAVVALLGWGAYPVFVKKVVDKLGEYTCLLFNHVVLVILLALTAIFTIRLKLPSDFVTAAVIIGAIVGAAAVYIFYKAIRQGDVAVVTVIAALYVVWTVVVSYFLFNERLALAKYIAIGVILVGIVLVSMVKPALPKKFDEKHLILFLKSDIWSKGAGLALFASFCWAFYNITVKYAVTEMGPHRTTVYMEALVLFFLLFAFLAKPAKELVTMPSKAEIKWLGPAALLFSLGAVGFYFAVRYTPISVVTPIVAAAPAVSVIGAAILLKERVKVHQYIGIALAVAGIVVLSM